jgi:hypothetical protein
MYYTGLGAVLARERREPTTSNWETEEFRVDALGNVVSDRAGNASYIPSVHRVSNYSFRGALNTRSELPNGSWPLENDTLVQVFKRCSRTTARTTRAAATAPTRRAAVTTAGTARCAPCSVTTLCPAAAAMPARSRSIATTRLGVASP